MKKANAAERRRRERLKFESLEPRVLLAGDTYLINFQADEASIPTRYVRDTGDLYGVRESGLTYGWSSDHTDQARERSVDPDQRLDTLIHIEAGQQWEFELASGSYEVTVAVGDPANNDGVHTVNVEGVNFFNAVPDGNGALAATGVVTVSDGRLTLNAGGAADKATRINYLQVVGVAEAGNLPPEAPTVTEPATDGQVVNPADVHMEAVDYADPDDDAHKSSDWQIWTTGSNPEPVWETLGIDGVERLHTHLGDGIFLNARAGETELAGNTDYELRVRFRDEAGSVSGYSSRLFKTAAASTIFPLETEDIADIPPTWVDLGGNPSELPAASALLSPVDAIIAIDADGGQSDYPPGESPQNAIDGTLDKYLNFGEINSGFIVTPSAGTATVTSFQITTANDAEERDPSQWALYGTNDPITSGDNSDGSQESWTLIDTGGVALPAARNTVGPIVEVDNQTAYASYRMLFTGVKNAGAANSMQLAEIQFYGEVSSTRLLSPGSPILAIDLDGGSAYPNNEEPQNAVDGTLDKYLNFGEVNSGFIVTPAGAATTVDSFQITTANDAAERDPTSWALYGTDDPIASGDNSNGTAENWTLIDSGTVSLPLARDTVGPLVAVANQTAYQSYRMIFTGVRNAGAANSMQIAEIEFFGESNVAPSPTQLRLESADGQPMLSIEGANAVGNQIDHFPELAEHADVRVVVEGGSNGLSLSETDLTFTDGHGEEHTIFLPAISLGPGQRLDLWVANSGATYFGNSAQTEPDFSLIARPATLDVPFIPMQPGYVVEEVGADYRLPVNIAFVPDPGPNPNDPLYYVTELYGSIQVVTRDGTKHEFATGLLDYNPQGPISGSGEQGLTGIAVERDATDPDVYHLYVGMLWDNGSPPGGAAHYPKVERIESVAGGLSMDSRTVLLNMQPETQGQSHQISNITIGPDGKLYVHNGDGFDASTAQDLDQYRGKILRMNLDGSAPTDNPFYNAANGINSRDYIYAYGVRNPFGGAWRASDGVHYSVENGPSVDRMSRIERGVNYGWNGSNASMTVNAIYNWNPAHAPVNITFVQPETFLGSAFPAEKMDRAYVSESGPTYAGGAQTQGKRIVEFELDASGNVVGGPTTLVEYVGAGRSTVVALAAGPDGLYFSELYEESGAAGPTASGARIFRVRYVAGGPADFDLDGNVGGSDLTRWEQGFGKTAAALVTDGDADGNGAVNGRDFMLWQQNANRAATQASANLDAATGHEEVHDAAIASLAEVAPLGAEGDLRELAWVYYRSEFHAEATETTVLEGDASAEVASTAAAVPASRPARSDERVEMSIARRSEFSSRAELMSLDVALSDWEAAEGRRKGRF